ncbi:porin family protein [Petrimonas sp.]|uniref:porin family protein n=1 Tax=Petrimonas sp. TaxID=2023866 RepID=UPI002FC8257A
MKTKKLWMILLAFLLMGGTVSAQLRFGIRGEVGINKPSFTKDVYSVENMNDFKVGPTLEFMLPVVDFGIEGSVLYSNEKMNIKTVNEQEMKTVVEDISNHSIDIPVNLKYKIGLISPVKIFLAAGPYANFWLAGDDFKYEAFMDKVEAKKFQAGVNLGAGLEVINHVAVGFNYRMKLTDDYSVNEPAFEDIFNQKDGFWSISATLFF